MIDNPSSYFFSFTYAYFPLNKGTLSPIRKRAKKEKVKIGVKPEKGEAFVTTIKEYMASLPYDGWISFNSDFTKFYRTEAVPMDELLRAER